MNLDSLLILNPDSYKVIDISLN